MNKKIVYIIIAAVLIVSLAVISVFVLKNRSAATSADSGTETDSSETGENDETTGKEKTTEALTFSFDTDDEDVTAPSSHLRLLIPTILTAVSYSTAPTEQLRILSPTQITSTYGRIPEYFFRMIPPNHGIILSGAAFAERRKMFTILRKSMSLVTPSKIRPVRKTVTLLMNVRFAVTFTVIHTNTR